MEEVYKNLDPGGYQVKGFGNPLEYLTFKGEESCVDFGSGGGFNCVSLSEKTTGQIFGVDILPKMIDYARKESKRKNIQYLQSDYRNLIFDDDRFDVAISNCSLLHHSDKKPYLDEMMRVLRRFGQFCIADITTHEVPYMNSSTVDEYIEIFKQMKLEEWHFMKEENIDKSGLYVSTFYGRK